MIYNTSIIREVNKIRKVNKIVNKIREKVLTNSNFHSTLYPLKALKL